MGKLIAQWIGASLPGFALALFSLGVFKPKTYNRFHFAVLLPNAAFYGAVFGGAVKYHQEEPVLTGIYYGSAVFLAWVGAWLAYRRWLPGGAAYRRLQRAENERLKEVDDQWRPGGKP
jgi:hypothetical protein